MLIGDGLDVEFLESENLRLLTPKKEKLNPILYKIKIIKYY